MQAPPLADPGLPDLRSAPRFLLRVAWLQRWTDAHTEARIADGLRRVREGRTTVVLTTSPLVLDRADVVVLLVDGVVVATGTHRSLLHHRAARHLERPLAVVVEGRTVVAIAHRLHTAADADRIAVVEDGRVTELGSHDELLARDGSYAALRHSWQSA